MKVYLRSKVKEFIAKRNWTYSDFSERLDCEPFYVSRLLNHQLGASAKMRIKIMRIFPELSFDDLFEFENVVE